MIMPGKHKGQTISFRPSAWARALIEQRAALSGLHKKDFITRSCIYSNIVVVGMKENIQRIVDALQDMQMAVEEIARQIQSGNFSLSDQSYQELKEDYLALLITIVDIVDGAAYLFNKEAPSERRNLKAELEVEQYRHVLEREQKKEVQEKENRKMD